MPSSVYTKHLPIQVPADIITFRYAADMVYVPPPSNYKEVISQAFNAFPQLRNTPTDCISLSLNVTVRGECHTVRISPSAWKKLRHRVTQYQIVDIAITEEPLYGHVSKRRAYNVDLYRQYRPYWLIEAPLSIGLYGHPSQLHSTL